MSAPEPCDGAHIGPPRCTYLHCSNPPVKQLTPSSGGRPWYGCEEHHAAMHDALLVGLSGAMSGTARVDVTPVIHIHRRAIA